MYQQNRFFFHFYIRRLESPSNVKNYPGRESNLRQAASCKATRRHLNHDATRAVKMLWLVLFYVYANDTHWNHQQPLWIFSYRGLISKYLCWTWVREDSAREHGCCWKVNEMSNLKYKSRRFNHDYTRKYDLFQSIYFAY